MNGTAEATWRAQIGIFQPARSRLERLGSWFDAEYPGLLRFAYFVCGSRAQAEDLVQDAFVRMYKAGARVEEQGIGAYARRTIVNLSRSGFRRASRETRALRQLDARAASDPDVDTRDEMWRAIQELSARQRAVVALKFYEDMSERDVAAALGMSTGSVKKHADRALTRLRARLGEGRQS
ncbi:MAG TPA: SigE family RNA polymerase sigma factor [Actinomycetota bacterium]